MIANHYGHLPTKLYSGIVLNNVVGGFNPYAVEHTAAAMGGKIVWLPTLAAENHLRLGEEIRLGAPGHHQEDAARDRRPCERATARCSTR